MSVIWHDRERDHIDTETTGQVLDTLPSPDSTVFETLSDITTTYTQERATQTAQASCGIPSLMTLVKMQNASLRPTTVERVAS